MSDFVNGLSKYNPLYILNNGVENNDMSCYLSTFIMTKGNSLYEYDITNLLFERKAVCDICTEYINKSIDYNAIFQNNFVDLITNLLNEESELFWEHLHVLFEIIYKVSAVSLCRKLLMKHIGEILSILSKALELEKRALCTTTYQDILSLQVASIFIKNKFCENSEIDDDALFDCIFQRLSTEQRTVENISTLSALRCCDKFVLSHTDIIREYINCSKESINYFWIYVPYVNRYKVHIGNVLISTLPDTIYCSWFENIVTRRVYTYNMSNRIDTLRKQIAIDLEQFAINDVYTFDSENIIKFVEEKRNEYDITEGIG